MAWSAITSRDPDDRWDLEAAVLDLGGGGEDLVTVERRLDHVVAEHVGQRERLSHRLDAVEVELVDVGEVLDDVAELHGCQGQLFVGQRQAGEPGDLGHLVCGDAVGHSPSLRSDRRLAAQRREPIRPLSGMDRRLAQTHTGWRQVGDCDRSFV